MAKEKTVTALVLSPGEMSPSDVDALLQDGFAETRIIKVGAKDGQVPAYIGKLIGPGRPVPMADDKTGEVSNVPTWQFKPIAKKDGEVLENVTHVMMAPYALNQALGSIFDNTQSGGKHEGKSALVGIVYNGQVDTRKGFRVNDYRIAEKYV